MGRGGERERRAKGVEGTDAQVLAQFLQGKNHGAEVGREAPPRKRPTLPTAIGASACRPRPSTTRAGPANCPSQ